ncbi:MAG: flagellar assembly protein A [bacterium]
MRTELLKRQHEALLQIEGGPVEARKRTFSVACSLNNNNMLALIKVETEDNECAISEFDILKKLYESGVRVGVDYDVMENIVKNKMFNKVIAVARGIPPENGKDAILIPQMELVEFSVSEEEKRLPGQPPTAGVPVELDQAIIVKQPAAPGNPGMTVLGQILKPKPGNDIEFVRGENVTISKDGLKLTAAIPGLAGLSNGKPCVREDNYEEWKFKVKLRKEDMEAVLVIVPGSGAQPEINQEFINETLKSNNIVFGIESGIAKSIPAKITITTVIKAAVGKPPVAGKNAVIIERFRDDVNKEQNLFRVKKGQLIVEKEPAQPGVKGTNVLGETLMPQEGKDIEIQAGINTRLSDDGLKLFAVIDGYVSRVKEAYCVIECKEFNPAKEAFPQMINFDGMIKISGDVPRDHTIIAGHHVVVQGNIIASEVVAGGFLQVQGDIQECTNKKVQAAGDMFLVSAKRARLRAGGNIYFSEKAHHCEIITDGGLYSDGKGSFSLIGGRVVAVRSVEADEFGASDKTQTIIEVGVPLPVRVRYENAVREMEELNRKRLIIEKELRRLLPLSKTKQITQSESDNMRKLILLRKTISEKIGQYKVYIDKLLPIIYSMSSNSSVTARASVNPGTILKIGIHKCDVEDNPGGALFKINKDNTAVISRKLMSQMKKELTIMFTDIVGYSTYTSKHGDLVASSLLNKHNELLFPIVEENEGRIIKTIGDSIMALFEKPECAVNAAIKMQTVLQEHNRDETDEHKIKIRIGINTGDGIIEGSDVFGDVVNMAARVESLTDADEIRISASTYSVIRGKVNADFSSLGLKKLKGKDEMIEIFDVIW